MNEWMNEWTNEQMDKQIDEQMDEQMDGWMDGWMYYQIVTRAGALVLYMITTYLNMECT